MGQPRGRSVNSWPPCPSSDTRLTARSCPALAFTCAGRLEAERSDARGGRGGPWRFQEAPQWDLLAAGSAFEIERAPSHRRGRAERIKVRGAERAYSRASQTCLALFEEGRANFCVAKKNGDVCSALVSTEGCQCLAVPRASEDRRQGGLRLELFEKDRRSRKGKRRIAVTREEMAKI